MPVGPQSAPGETQGVPAVYFNRYRTEIGVAVCKGPPGAVFGVVARVIVGELIPCVSGEYKAARYQQHVVLSEEKSYAGFGKSLASGRPDLHIADPRNV